MPQRQRGQRAPGHSGRALLRQNDHPVSLQLRPYNPQQTLALPLGTRLGVYEIVARIGEGGMGQVYRATDTTLGRQVAIKILPDAFAADPERLARFEREAKTLASLNHPHIAAIYGFEKSGAFALVMELVEGEDLSQRIARGAIPLDEALPIARQIAEALEAAHEQGIVHRDLKPANIQVRPDGTVKVLDFGLAKAMEPASTTGVSAMNSPTLSIHTTRAGIILGTAAYMSPEQARGQAVDKRADIWSFGAVLYEMVTGTRLFDAPTVTDSLAAILTRDPDLTVASETTRHLLRRCLEKDPKKRLRDIGDAMPLLEQPPLNTAGKAERARPLAADLALVLIAVGSLAFAALALWNRPTAVQNTAARLTIPLLPGQEITSYPAITRDGRTVAYVTQQGSDDSQLYLRDLNSFEARVVAGSSGARQPFFSPDGKWVAFFAQGQLRKAEVAGGSPIRLAEAAYPFGGTWSDDNTIIYSGSINSGLLRIPASGGTPESLTKPDGAEKGYSHAFPQALPGGRNILFKIWGQTQGGAVYSLDSGQWEMVLPGPMWAAPMFDPTGGATGRLLVIDESAGIKAAPFDPAHPARTSADTSVLANVYYDVENEVRGWLSIANNRTAVYAPGNPAKTSLVWVDRDGKIESMGQDQDVYREASLSPDGTKAAVRHNLDLWIHDLQRGTRIPLTTGNASNLRPLWSRDGTRIIFISNRGGDWDIYSQPADGSRPAEALLKRPYDQVTCSILADGTLLYGEIHPKTGLDLWTLSPDGKTSPVRVTSFNETDGQFSPGPEGGPRWIAYASDESGRSEIYLQSYPGGANRTLVSVGGGILPRWSRDGKELFYATGDAVVAVAIRPDGSFGAPRRLFDRSNYFLKYHSYDVSPDGKRFLMIRRDPGSVPRQLNVILNWSDETYSTRPITQ
jgi:Tol biopolymer transport system component